MATQAELQEAVQFTTQVAAQKRTAWKAAIPGEGAEPPTDREQEAIDGLEGVYRQARDARKAAEDALSAATPPAKTGGRQPKFDHRLLTGYY